MADIMNLFLPNLGFGWSPTAWMYLFIALW